MLGWRDWKRMTAGEIAVQIGVLVLVITVVVRAYFSATIKLAELGITSGFNFLDRDTGWGYSFSLIERSVDDTYRKALLIGFSDLFYIVSTSIIQSGQTLELIGNLMAGFLAVNFTLVQIVSLLNARLALKGYGS